MVKLKAIQDVEVFELAAVRHPTCPPVGRTCDLDLTHMSAIPRLFDERESILWVFSSA